MTTFYRIPKLALAAVSLGICSLFAAGCNLFPVTPLLDKILVHKNSAVIFTAKYVFIPKPLPVAPGTQSNPDARVNVGDLVDRCKKHELSCCYARFLNGKRQDKWIENVNCLTTNQKNNIDKAAEVSGATDYAGYFGKPDDKKGTEGKGGDTCMKTMIKDVSDSPALQNHIALLLARYNQ